MSELIQFIKTEPRVSTSIIADGLGIEHKSLIRLIENHKDDLIDFGKIEEGKENLKSDLKSTLRNRKTLVFFLNEQQFALVGTYTKNTEKSKNFKKKLVKEFFRMRDIINNLKFIKLSPEYNEIRIEGKIIRKTFTDTINILKQYSLEQNPNANIGFLFSNYTKVLNNGIFDVEGKFNNIREVCNIEQLKTLELLENECSKIILSEMEKNTNYKDIYYIIKEKINGFAQLFGKSKVINNQKSIG